MYSFVFFGRGVSEDTHECMNIPNLFTIPLICSPEFPVSKIKRLSVPDVSLQETDYTFVTDQHTFYTEGATLK